jgi:sugar transferase (PEP-CTERM/EpsH1 system associated)
MLDSPALARTVASVVAKHPPDVVFAFCSGIAHVALTTPLVSRPLVIDMVDVDSAKWESLSHLTRPPRSWIYAREARTLGSFERRVALRAHATLVTTERERETLRRLAPQARIEVVQNGVDAEGLRPSSAPADAATVVFCGVMNYLPNEQAAVWIAREVWPLVKRTRPDARLSLVGSHPSPAVRALASAEMMVEVTGYVPDVRPYLWNAAVAAAPLQVARGVQNKVLEAVASGLPAVITPVVASGLPPEILPACTTAGDPAAFAAAILALLEESADSRRARANRADLAAITWSRRLAPIADLLTEAAGS